MNGTKLTDSQFRKFRKTLLSWYRRNSRTLPWRDEPSLYKTVISEFMLQQTQVNTVLGHFERWLRRFPDFDTLSRAPENEVLKHWEGLGYYSRARNLHRLAGCISKMSSIPRTPDEWMRLPGVGPYTAAAVTSIAFGERSPCVDGNVVRILSRIQADPAPYRDSASAAKTYAPFAALLVDPDNPGDHNQAMMELGATVCTRRRPRCPDCPVSGFCRAAAENNPESYPKLATKKFEKVHVTRLWCRRGDELLLRKTDSNARRLAGIYELPEAVDLGLDPSGSDMPGVAVAKKRRSITRFQITETIRRYTLPVDHNRIHASSLEWISTARLSEITLSGPHRKWVNELLAGER